MRTEAAIRKHLEARQSSKYRQFYRAEIGALLWVLGEAKTMRQGMYQEFMNDKTIIK